ncbi:DJ-1/PfpI family protein [Roseibium algae]|uniref:DJ-1/PfpI family protein n=1 Tax=Roseibium algae TaxID=3123038 RepID=A0ABU8TQ84_9HYPH
MTLRFGILAFPNVQLLDFAAPYDAFAAVPDAEVLLVSQTTDTLRASTGLSFLPAVTFADCPQVDVLCVPGGAGVNALLGDEPTLAFIRDQAAAAQYVTSVCTGSLLLGAAGLLQGKRATSHWYARDFLKHYGATPVDERIVQDGNVITAGGVTSGIDFGLAVIQALKGQLEAETVQLSIEYAPKPPFNSGTPSEALPEVLSAAKKRLASSRLEREAFFAKLR